MRNDRVGICEEHQVEWAIVQHCRVCNLTAERDSLKAQQDVLLAALEPFAVFGRYLQEHPREGLANELYGWDGEVYVRKNELIKAAEVVAKAGQP